VDGLLVFFGGGGHHFCVRCVLQIRENSMPILHVTSDNYEMVIYVNVLLHTILFLKFGS